jgi:hypothetical protein
MKQVLQKKKCNKKTLASNSDKMRKPDVVNSGHSTLTLRLQDAKHPDADDTAVSHLYLFRPTFLSTSRQR